MLTELVNLPLGITVSLGTFLIASKYLYCSVYILWAFGSARRASGKIFLLGLLALVLVTSETVRIPLERPYGLTLSSPLLPSFADAMAATETGRPMEGWLLNHPAAHPAWSALLALVSGLDSSRLLRFLPWLGALTMILFASGTLAALGLVDPSRGKCLKGRLSGAHFAVAFAVFLSSSQIDFLYSQPIYGLNLFFIAPHRSLALPLMLCTTAVFLARSRAGILAGALSLGALAYLETTYVLSAGVALTTALVVFRKSSTKRFERLIFLATGLCLGIPRVAQLLTVPGVPNTASLTDTSWSRLTSTWTWPSPMLVLSLLAIAWMLSRRPPIQRVLLPLLGGVVLTVVFATVDTPIVNPEAAHVALRFLLCLCAGYGFHFLVQELGERAVKGGSRHLTTARMTGLGLLLLVSFTFPYWWQPRTMDPYYRKCLSPVSPRMETLAAWIRENTESESVFLVWKNVGPWVPALTGRRAILGEESEYVKSHVPFPTILDEMTGGDISRSRTALRRLGVTHLVVLRTDVERLPNLPALVADGALEPVFSVRRWARVFSVSWNRRED